MAHFAELNENNEVIYVAYMDNEIITDENGAYRADNTTGWFLIVP